MREEWGSIAEVKSQLYTALDFGVYLVRKSEKTYEMISEVARLVIGFIKYSQDK